MARADARHYRPKYGGTRPGDTHDQATYSPEAVGKLVEGTDGLHWGRNWAELRSRLEQHGRIAEGEDFVEVMDFEVALGRLGQRHPDAAMVVTLRMHGYEYDELTGVFGRRRNWARLGDRAQAWITAYLAGQDPEATW